MPKSAKKQARMENQSSEDEDDGLEMERNFALLSQRGAMQTSVEDEEEEDESGEEEDGSGEEEDESGEEEDESGEEEDGSGEEEDESGEEEDESGEEEDGSGEEEDGSGVEEDDAVDDDEDGYSKEAFREESTMTSDTKEGFRNDLSSMPFEEIMKLQNKFGTKAYNKIAYGATKQKQNTEPKKRLNRQKPQEMSAKKRVPYIRKVVAVKKKISRDPRFDDLSGEYKPEIFNKTYKFIDLVREKELQMVKKKMKKAKSEDKKEELKALLKRLENQQRAREKQDKDREKELQFKKKVREMVGQGHRPFYLKNSDKRKMELAEKFSELKKSGKLENFLNKKRKRNATKDRRKLPNLHYAQ